MCIDTKYIYLKNHPLFRELEEVKLMELTALVKVNTVYRGDSVSYGDGDYGKIYFVVKGKIKLPKPAKWAKN